MWPDRIETHLSSCRLVLGKPLHFYSTALGSRLTGLPQPACSWRGEFRLSFITKPAMISNVWCLEICAGTLFVMLLKFGAVLSIICGFLMAIYTWTHLLQCIVVVWSFLRMLKLRKLAVRKLYLLRGGRTLCQGVLEHGLNLHQNIPLIKPDWTGTELNRTCENPVEPGVT